MATDRKRKIVLISVVLISMAALVYVFWKKILVLAFMAYLLVGTIVAPFVADYKASNCEYVYSTSTDVDGVSIRVGLVHNHVFLAEYRWLVHINGGPCIDFGREPGGYAYVNVYSLDDRIVLQSFAPNIMIIDKKTGEYLFEARELRDEEILAFVGKFHFAKGRRYVFTTMEVEPEFSEKVMKGG